MKIHKTDFLVCCILFVLGGLVAYAFIKSPNEPKKPSHERILYLRDSLEMEWYKRTLDEAFFFEHSKIPENESDTGIQSTR